MTPLLLFFFWHDLDVVSPRLPVGAARARAHQDAVLAVAVLGALEAAPTGHPLAGRSNTKGRGATRGQRGVRARRAKGDAETR